MPDMELYLGDCVDTMRRRVSRESVQCCVTSPPYYGLRDYGVAGQIGLEETPEQYVERLVEVFREVRRVLKDDGTLWVNLGDSYNSSPSNQQGQRMYADGDPYTEQGGKARKIAGLKTKDLIGIPWMVAFALRADGWYLRQDIIWAKSNPMPESVTDRCTKAHEYIFLLSKSGKYYYDADAISEIGTNIAPRNVDHKYQANGIYPGAQKEPHSGLLRIGARTARNKRSVWTVASEPYAGAHFATYPTKLIEPCILAGSRLGDIVLDPFNGSGTTGLVALRHGRKYIGIDLNEEYLNLTNRRLLQVSSQRTIFDEMATVLQPEQEPLFEVA